MIPSIDKIKKGLNNPRQATKYATRKIGSYPRNAFTNTSIFVTSRKPFGKNIFTEEWDLLIILDSARYDMMADLTDEYEFLSNVERIWSVGSTSPEWMANTFSEQYMAEISRSGYVTDNPHSATVLENDLAERFQGHRKDITKLQRYGQYDIVPAESLGLYDPVWKRDSGESRYDLYENYGVPRNVTDRAIRTARQNDLDRLILHYMPPHRPFLINAIREDREPYEYERSPWGYIRKTGDKDTAMGAAKDMLRWVLDDVELLLENIDADKVVITSDHGNGFGEFGTYGHPAGSLQQYVRRVPWVTTTATDSNSYEPEMLTDEDRNRDDKSGVLEERLASLGYL
ncbi:hypothetical protein OB919_20975 [Halobacteria archaeon AArc-curdl1]|uniref:Uncharacterized protein n=1 Tax=Natronosalvus hydrolyticus TaxID=2979988 RepID=A0AAP2ZBX2_9EURY|nr:hypothetical protein [Halobacteria archaeon AArc-curdl1]